MPELPIIGQVENPGELDLDPIIVPVAGYTLERKEVIERFPFKPTMPPGTRALMERSLGPNGEIQYGTALVILNRCLIVDAQDRWGEFLDRDDLNIAQDTLGDVLKAIYEVYTGRPTRSRSGSSTTGPRRSKTSKAEQLSTEQT